MDDLKITLPKNSGVATYPPGAAFGPRSMQDWEFVWLIQGDAEYCWGETAVAAREGSVVLCRPGATDFFQWDRHRRTRHAFFHFQMGNPPAGWEDWPLVREPANDDILHPLFRHVLTWTGRGDPEQCRRTIETMLSAFRTGQRATGSVAPEDLPRAVEVVCAFIARHLDDDPALPISLTTMAGAACVTPEHLCRVFRASLGYSPAETVRLARLDRAATLLARSNYSVSEIASLCGFVSPFHFSRLFKAAYGRSPRALRQDVHSGATLPLPRLVRTSILDK
ncbi:MAG: helix-turn-helix transcriptional regulator [Janthinobacterium lividum]